VQWAPYLLEAEEYHAGNRALRPFYSPFESQESGSRSSYPPGSVWAPGGRYNRGDDQ